MSSAQELLKVKHSTTWNNKNTDNYTSLKRQRGTKEFLYKLNVHCNLRKG